MKALPHENCGDMRFEAYHNAKRLYAERGEWKNETCLRQVEDWDPVDLISWVEASMARHVNGCLKVGTLVRKLLIIIEEEGIDGHLLLAGGNEYLMEKAGLAIRNKSDCQRLPHAVAFIFGAVQVAVERAGKPHPYWDRMWEESETGRAVCEEYGAAAGAGLRLALEPHPLSDIHFAALHTREKPNVILADDVVFKHDVSAFDCLFKVVSVTPRDDPCVVWSNLIYVHSDLGVVKDENASLPDTASRAQRRRLTKHKRSATKDTSGHWVLTASVDFAPHGSAPPGHWHLNRTTCGDILPHLRLSLGQGEKRNVWHGGEDCCPLWWHFVPEGMVHKNVPPRLQSLTKERNQRTS
uniref:Uncharacterized protein n=1 Tax=Odontella aurita TaxID=265563 RepID=A0A7S4NC56_9STRA